MMPAWRSNAGNGAQPYLALDTEFMRVDTFYPAAGLVQVGDGRQEWLIDPLLIQDWSPSPNCSKTSGW